jgi:outer membrane receptor protein involved in Fe transport
MICGVALAAGGQAFAQEKGTNVQEIVVTGSRIPTKNLTSTSPLTVVGDQEIKLQGTTNVESLINNLPQAVASAQSGTTVNGSAGINTIDLRGLGAPRTLVLIDGKRLMPADPNANTGVGQAADVSVIPEALVDNVQVVTGGASAVYGSDAVAGVVNFIMKRNFEGVRIDAQYGWNNHHNGNPTVNSNGDRIDTFLDNAEFPTPANNVTTGETFDITTVVGVNTPDGKGNATLYASYENQKAVLQSQYDFDACGLSTHRSRCQGSVNKNLFISNDLAAAGASNYYFFGMTDRTFQPFSGAPNEYFNFGPLNYLQRPEERYLAGGFAHYEVNPHLDAYLDFMFSDSHTFAQIAPSGLFLGTGVFAGAVHINCDNPLMSAQEAGALGCGTILGPTDDASLLIGRRNIEGGNRTDDLRHTSYKIDIGAKGEIVDGWHYDVYGQYGTTLYAENYSNELSVQRVQNALEVVTDTRPGSQTFGQPVCKVVVQNIDPRCVPLDVFSGLGAWTPAMEQYVGAQGFKTGLTAETVVSADITGDLSKIGAVSPGATDGVSVALGAEYRRESIELQTSRDFQINDLYGQGSPTLPVPRSSFQVYELFGEVNVPILQDKPFAKELDFHSAYRWSDYSTVGTVSTYSFSGDWAPVNDFKLRASFNRAVRAPNVLESFAPNNNILIGADDPCAGAAPAASAAECANTGVRPDDGTSGSYGHILQCPADQCKHVVGGNPFLKPESADTWTVGAVLTPTFFRGFTATIDWYDIKVNNLISNIGFGDATSGIVGGCLTSGLAFYCDKIKRDALGTLWTDSSIVEDTSLNLGYEHTRGIDFEANYRVNLADWHLGDVGSLAFNFAGTWVDKFEILTVPPDIAKETGTPITNCLALVGNNCQSSFVGAPVPKWRHKFRITWNAPWKFSLSAQWRYFGPVDGEDSRTGHIGSQSWFDLSGTWTVKDRWTLRAGLNNVFDKDPPIIPYGLAGTNSNGNGYPQTYDSLGRTAFIGIQADF